MKLTIEHLAPYLPYGLYFYKKKLHSHIRKIHPHDDDCNEKIIRIYDKSRKGKMIAIKSDGKVPNKIVTRVGTFELNQKPYYRNSFQKEHWRKNKYIEWYKPILRPLSDLTKEIEYDGEKFVPIEILANVIGGKINIRDKRIIGKAVKALNYEILTGSVQYVVIKKLLEWHFDVFGLIENNLAIDKNTIT